MIGPQPTPAPALVAPTPAYVTRAFLSNILPQLRHLRRAICFPRLKTAPFLLKFLHTKIPNTNLAQLFFCRTLTFQGSFRTAKNNSYSRLYFYEVRPAKTLHRGGYIYHNLLSWCKRHSMKKKQITQQSCRRFNISKKRKRRGVWRHLHFVLEMDTASSSEKGNKNYNLSAKIMSYGPKSDRLETSPVFPFDIDIAK